ncbi:membrane hypothetical protein [Xenorhabdus szentirmaii DSM 16338]|uniref:Uncharacterized protein n=1 Tax=Xenorhabdus szentirmaii DSM 16338 TaxID=1427518 RepID=W1IXC8_9GAMM|nr:membrane hypothetical protein [Xenorhabdus szentirmaii DSM 16338]
MIQIIKFNSDFTMDMILLNNFINADLSVYYFVSIFAPIQYISLINLFKKSEKTASPILFCRLITSVALSILSAILLLFLLLIGIKTIIVMIDLNYTQKIYVLFSVSILYLFVIPVALIFASRFSVKFLFKNK